MVIVVTSASGKGIDRIRVSDLGNSSRIAPNQTRTITGEDLKNWRRATFRACKRGAYLPAVARPHSCNGAERSLADSSGHRLLADAAATPPCRMSRKARRQAYWNQKVEPQRQTATPAVPAYRPEVYAACTDIRQTVIVDRRVCRIHTETDTAGRKGWHYDEGRFDGSMKT